MKYLVVMLDPQLKFNKHVVYFKKKLIGRLKMFGRMRPLVGQDLSLHLCKTLVLPVLDYCDVVCDSLSVRDCQTLQSLQNYALRIILQADYSHSTADMHEELHMKKLSSRRHIHTLNNVYMCMNDIAPKSVFTQSVHSNSAHTRYT